MEIYEVPGRDNALLGQLLELWERSVQASHTFLSPAEISAIRECVPDALAGVAHLVIARGGDFIKLMASGLMDFHTFGALTDTPCDAALLKDLVSVAHDHGLSVMVHANGHEAVSAALSAGVESIEHGAYLLPETLHQLSESGAVWVPTLVTIGNLRGKGRFPDQVLTPLLALQQENVAEAARLGANIALGTEAGAYAVYHGQAVLEEYDLLHQALGAKTDEILRRGEAQIRAAFQKK